MPSNLRLMCLVLNADADANNIFAIDIPHTETVGTLKQAIKAKNHITFQDVEADALRLWKVSIPVDKMFTAEISKLHLDDDKWLSPVDELSDEFSDIPKKTLHVVVRAPVAAPLENSRVRDRESVVEKAKSRPSPSNGAKLDNQREVQNPSEDDAIYNHRSLTLSAESVTIYHSAFTEFINDISAPLDSLDFSDEELASAADVMEVAMRFYKNEDYRVVAMRKAVGSTLDKELFTKTIVAASRGPSSTVAQPDGLLMVVCSNLPGQPMGFYGVEEAQNEGGEGGSDSVAQAECDYRAIVSRDEYAEIRKASCCPMFLVSNTGPLITVSGAVFTDRLICQRLTPDAIFVGPRHSTVGDRTPLDEGQRKVAQLIIALRKGLGKLKEFYRTLEEPDAERCDFPSPPQFHSYCDHVTQETCQLIYRERLLPFYPEKAIFRATAVGPQGRKEVVVKFTRRYGVVGHTKLAEVSLAPALRFCKRVDAVGMFVVVMDYVNVDAEQDLPKKWKEGLKKGMDVLHESNLVFGDLRLPNLLLHEGGIKFIDFDWCGEEGVARYPGDLCDHGWHPDVKGNGLMKKEHDVHMFKALQVLKRHALDDVSSRETKLARFS